MGSITIANKRIGVGHPAFIIAEVAQAHEGSLGTAHAYIDAVAETGADAIKFQTHLACYESTLDEPFRVRFGAQDETRFAYWQRMEFSPTQWAGLAAHAKEKGLIFLSSPFSVEAVALLRAIGMPAWKLGSGEFRSVELLDAIADSEEPVLLSTGMSRRDEIESIVATMDRRHISFAILQCVSLYPTPLERVGLNLLDEFRHKYAVPVGLSDHSGSIYPSLAAIARGANIVEVHVIVDRRLFGPDALASVTIDELKIIVNARNAFQVMDRNPVDKDAAANQLQEMRQIFTKSIAIVRPLTAGTVLSTELLVPRKPGTGIPYTELSRIVGRRLKQNVEPNRLLRWEDIDDPA